MNGVFAAVLTPMKADLSPDHGALVGHCRWLLDQGCDGLSVLGTTGEANSLSVGERLDILDALAQSEIPCQALLPGTGCPALPDTVRLSRRAIEIGAPGVLMLPPFFYKNVSDDGLFASYCQVIEAVGDSRLRVYLYHFPKMSAVPINLSLIERLLKRYPEVIAGVKDSSGDLANMTAMVRAFPGFKVFSGSDEAFLPLLKEGGAGCVTAFCNVAPQLAARVYGKRSEEASQRITQVRMTVSAYPQIAALKAVMAHYAKDKSWLNIRPPLTRLSDDQAQALFKALDGIGFAPPPPPEPAL